MTYVIIEPEKSGDPMFASWSPRKAGSIIQSKSKDVRGASGVNPSPGLEKR